MNKKLLVLFPVMATLLLTACPRKRGSDYHYDDYDDVITFDYSFNNDFKTAIGQLSFDNGGEVSDGTLSRFISSINLNDFYANRVIITSSRTLTYLDNSDQKVAGDYDYLETRNITRDNDKNSLSGTVTIRDETWYADEDDPTNVLRNRVNATGTYSLVADVETGIGHEIVNTDREEYNSNTIVGYSQGTWSDKMNLTQSSLIGEKFNDVRTIATNSNEGLANEYKYVTSVKSYTGNNSLTITLESKSRQPSTYELGNFIEISYKVSVSITGDMITKTSYQYMIIETGEFGEAVIESELEQREMFYDLR